MNGNIRDGQNISSQNIINMKTLIKFELNDNCIYSINGFKNIVNNELN